MGWSEIRFMDKRILYLFGFVSLIIILFIYSFYPSSDEWSQEEFQEYNYGEILSTKPSLSAEIVTNPDFVYEEEGWFTKDTPFYSEGNPLLERTEIDWESGGWYEKDVVDDRDNFIIIHPYSTRLGDYVQRSFYLSGGSYNLVVGIANIAGKAAYAETTGCDDVGFLIKIIDQSGKENKLFNKIINSNDGWVDISFDIKDLSGQTITVRVESYAGGPCGDWRAEWAAVDYIDIIKK